MIKANKRGTYLYFYVCKVLLQFFKTSDYCTCKFLYEYMVLPLVLPRITVGFMKITCSLLRFVLFFFSSSFPLVTVVFSSLTRFSNGSMN